VVKIQTKIDEDNPTTIPLLVSTGKYSGYLATYGEIIIPKGALPAGWKVIVTPVESNVSQSNKQL